ncbi:protein PAXX-like [Sinocyclocheilus anshuiensis]|uniref:Protein PAXX-like n=1 Tax=Sinocyclocheilus anshuiensis TaxID=1608454 RepID=A0A671NRQ0_9TELE|nr:PREDICTED: protein PAXX-like [Sinocyclocheilus anshuiensis]
MSMEQNSESKSVLCTLLDKNDQSKYVFFTQKRSAGDINIGCTNGEDVWKTHLSEEILSQLFKTFSLKSTEDYTFKLKCACKAGRAFVKLQEDSAVLHLGSEHTDLSLSLSKLKDSEGRTEVKELLFKMADSLQQLESQGSSSSFSPVKSPQKRSAEFEPRKQHKGPVVEVRKRLPGDSLINPGTKRKKPATGVAFDDEDDD